MLTTPRLDRGLRDLPVAPTSARVAVAGMLVAAVIRAGQLLANVGGFVDRNGFSWILVLAIGVSGLFVVGPSLIVALGIRRGWRAAPIVVTVIGLLGSPYLLALSDPVSVALGLASIAAVIAVWLPSARAFAAEMRRARARLASAPLRSSVWMDPPGTR